MAEVSSERRARRVWWAVLFTSHLVAVLGSRGYYHPDEHFQVLEFIQWKLGLVATGDMPWELPERVRPWLHPLLLFPLEWLSLHVFEISPFVKSAVHRACVAALALFVIHRLTRGADPRLLFVYAVLFFFPFLDARISSEVIGGWLFALGYTLDRGDDDEVRPAHALGAGLVFGVAAVIRLQLWAMLGGLLLFHLLRRRVRYAAWLVLGCGIAVVIGVLADRWGYGQFVFVPWNYVHQNLVLDRASRFGVSPPYAYGPLLLESTAYLPGAAMIAALLSQWIRRPVTRLTFATLPFVLLHVAIPHKELRFLFPLAPLLPLMLLALWNDFGRIAWLRKPVATAFVAVNLALLVPAAARDVLPVIGLYGALREHAPDPTETLYCRGDCKLVLRPSGLYMSYYLGQHRRTVRVLKRARPHPGLTITTSVREHEQVRERGGCTLLESRYPDSVVDALRQLLPRDRADAVTMWSLWRCP